MRKHPRFNPILGITTNTIEAPGSKPILEKYIKEKKYDYIDLDLSPQSIDKIHPDLILYYKPYDGSYLEEQVFWKHKHVIPLGIPYAFNTTCLKQHFTQPLYYWSYIYFAENEFTKQSFKNAIGFKSYNIRVTGTPMEDELLLPKENFEDQWKDRTGRKRIIYAPHHSFDGTNGKGLELATFLVNGEFMLEMAKKYSNRVTFAFKPHPNLRKKLNNIWGKERTDAYYHEWESLEYAQVDYGDYMGLFKYSDAIIHDCGSFTIEYLFMQKPSMYMVNGSEDRVKAELNDFGKKAFECYEHGLTHEQIEAFINEVINGEDKLKNKRQEFFDKYLKPPYGRTACENIIRSILGEKL
jgi:CDP-glycerol glycerophosphotransferase (TagB/SpsB family)